LFWAGIGSFGAEGFPVADGYMAYLNTYDMQVYCIGKGPSATTVSAPQTEIAQGTRVLLTGTVTDQSAGAKALLQSSEFNVVPAISDQSMGAWMQYLYMQKPKPTNATGVTLKLTATDPNGNFQVICTATSNSLGNYAIAWTPPVPGLYTVTATFEGTNGYYGSEAGTYFIVSAAASPVAVVSTSPVPSQTVAPSSAPTSAQTSTVTSPSPSVAPQPTSGIPTTTYIAIAAGLVLRKRK